MNEQVKKFKSVAIDAISFAERFHGRKVKYATKYRADGSVELVDVIIDGVGRLAYNNNLYLKVIREGYEGTLWCTPEYLINSGNDFSK